MFTEGAQSWWVKDDVNLSTLGYIEAEYLMLTDHDENE